MPKSIKKLYNAWGQKMKQILNEQKGVTLIALVITIIVLLILTGVTIAMLTGDNGIISKAMQAKTKTEDSKETEEAGLKEIENYINGKSAEAGVVVQDLKSIKSDGTEGEVIGEKVSDGAGGVVPIPSGFYYVGGTAKSGTVISDNLADKDKYKGQELVGTDLSGNQFVFIPVNGIDEHSRLRYTWFTNAHDTYASSEFVRRLVKYFPFKVKTIQTDNGFEFTNRLSWQAFMKNKKTMFEKTIEELGIEYKVIKPHTPKQNGRVERSHRKDQERFYYKRVFYSLEDLRNQGKEWRKEYNNFPMRPLGWLSPREFIKKYKSQEESLFAI